MYQYHDLLMKILNEGELSENRTGVKALGIWGHVMRFDLSKGFPLITTKKIHFKSVVTELVFFLKGYTDVRWLQERKCRIWNEWATAEQCGKRGLPEFDLGPIYGWQWRHFGADYVGMKNDETAATYAGKGVDQLLWAQQELRNNPSNRQILMSAWNPVDKPRMALPPCHVLVHFRASHGKLNTLLVQRSCDTFLGVPFNIASYALLTHMMAQACGLFPGEFVHILNDVHIYENHVQQVREQLSREPRPLPSLALNQSIRDIDKFEPEHVSLDGYDPHPAIHGVVAV